MKAFTLLLGAAVVCALTALPACRSGNEGSTDSSNTAPPSERTATDVPAERTAAPTTPPAQRTAATTTPTGGVPAKAAAPQVVIDTSMGKIVVELDADRTPVTVKNFLQYVDDKFYDNTIFHRVIKSFMIQGGGYNTSLDEKPTRDPIVNEVRKGRSNTRGTIAMARTNDMNSATSQFFINHKDNLNLDTGGGGYCAFGRVVEGMDVVDSIASTPTHNMGGAFANIPVEQVVIKSIRRK
jgi:peptidyl-prolyl cis-trans isomerase A (cyclophilin A)